MDTRDMDEDVPDRESGEQYDPNPEERGKGISALVALLGAWMIAEGILFDLVATQFWNDVIVGVLLLAVGGYNYMRRSDEQLGNLAAALLVALLGLWLLAAPFMFGADAGTTETMNDLGFWNDLIVGMLALALGGYSAYEIRERQQRVEAPAG